MEQQLAKTAEKEIQVQANITEHENFSHHSVKNLPISATNEQFNYPIYNDHDGDGVHIDKPFKPFLSAAAHVERPYPIEFDLPNQAPKVHPQKSSIINKFIRYDAFIIILLVSLAIFVPYYLFSRRKKDKFKNLLLREDPVFVVPDPPVGENARCLSTIPESAEDSFEKLDWQ